MNILNFVSRLIKKYIDSHLFAIISTELDAVRLKVR